MHHRTSGKRKGVQEKLGQADSEDIRGRSTGLPETCPELVEGCQGTMRIISSIEDQSVIRDILTHLGLWLARARPPPKAHTQWRHDAASCPHASLAIFSFKHTLIRSTATLNTLGMPIFRHNASSKKACRRGLSGLCQKMPSCRVT